MNNTPQRTFFKVIKTMKTQTSKKARKRIYIPPLIRQHNRLTHLPQHHAFPLLGEECTCAIWISESDEDFLSVVIFLCPTKRENFASEFWLKANSEIWCFANAIYAIFVTFLKLYINFVNDVNDVNDVKTNPIYKCMFLLT